VTRNDGQITLEAFFRVETTICHYVNRTRAKTVENTDVPKLTCEEDNEMAMSIFKSDYLQWKYNKL
jgi:hypothetical protein